MFSADNVLINYIRPPVVQMDPRTMGVTAQVAQDLGLTDGQVIQATAEVRDNVIRLVLKGFKIDAPTFKVDAPTFKTSAPTFKLEAPSLSGSDLKDGQSVELRASLGTEGWTLTPNVNTNLNPSTTSNNSVNINLNPNLASNAQNLGTGSGVGELAAAHGLSANGFALNQNMASSGVLPNWSARVNSLMFDPSKMSVIFELLMPEVFSRALVQPQLQSWLQRWNANRLSMAGVNAGALKNLVLGQSRSLENRIASQSVASHISNSNNYSSTASGNTENINTVKNSLNSEDSELDGLNGLNGLNDLSDPKSMLSSLSALLSQMPQTDELGKLNHQIKTANHELESAQIQSVQHLLRSELGFHVVIPFVDADPVDLYFKKNKTGKDDDPTPSYSVDIHSKSRVLGEVWLNTTIVKSTQVDLIMWAVSPEVAELAKTNASELGYELSASGLTLNSFQIFNAPKPSELEEPKPSSGSVLDTRV